MEEAVLGPQLSIYYMKCTTRQLEHQGDVIQQQVSQTKIS